jgi:rhodanese-related sulfurtransferase/DNA-binding transcriptional ArsR family regulator
MNAGASRDLLFVAWADIAKGLSSPKRIELLDVLAQGERSVEVLADLTQLSVTNTSAHLLALKRARLVETRKQAQFVFYRLADDGVVRVLREIQSLAHRRVRDVAHVMQTFVEATDTLEPIGTAELRRRLRSGDVTLIDVRPDAEYRAGHIAGALSVPLETLQRRLRTIPKGQPVVAYCRGPYCVLAVEAVARLRRRGYAARRFADGFPGWKADGHPVRTGTDR